MKIWTAEDIAPEQTELATSLRVPFLLSPYPSWHYITGIVVSHDLWGGITPNEDEVRLVGAWLKRYNKFYNQGYLNKMAEHAPYDIDGSANLGYLLKRGDDEWFYRKRTWEFPPWWPTHINAEHEHWSLERLLPRIFDGWTWIENKEKEA